MASTLSEHSGLVCNSIIGNNSVYITIKHIKNDTNINKDIIYNMSGSEINVYYFTKLIDEWVLQDTKFNFNYREVIKHEKKDIETIRDEFNPKTKRMEPVRITEETVSIYFRDSAVLFRVSA